VNSPERNTPDGVILKLDQAVKERHRLSVEFGISNGFSRPAQIFPTAADSAAPTRHVESRRVALDHVFTLSPNTVNTADFKVTRYVVHSGEEQDRLGYPDLLGLTGTSAPYFPVISIQPYVSMGRLNPANGNAANDFTWTDAISVRRGKHTLKLSGEYTAHQLNIYNPLYPSSLLRFGSGLTSLPGIVNTGHAFASFLLGQAEYGQASIVPSPSYFRQNDFTAAVTEHFEIRPNLVFSIGLTLARGSPRIEKFDRQSNIDLEAINPENGRKGALVAAGQNGVPRGFRPAMWYSTRPPASPGILSAMPKPSSARDTGGADSRRRCLCPSGVCRVSTPIQRTFRQMRNSSLRSCY
jgi:hypothetical protein